MGVPISDNEMLAIGTEVEIVDVRHGCYISYYMCIIPGGRQIPIEANEIEITDYTPFMDWKKLRVEFANSAMQGILSNIYKEKMNYSEICVCTAKVAVEFADALIKELKNK